MSVCSSVLKFTILRGPKILQCYMLMSIKTAQLQMQSAWKYWDQSINQWSGGLGSYLHKNIFRTWPAESKWYKLVRSLSADLSLFLNFHSSTVSLNIDYKELRCCYKSPENWNPVKDTLVLFQIFEMHHPLKLLHHTE